MSVAVIVAHPDDEVLGVGGTLARHAKQGDAVQVVIVADGETSRPAHAADAVGTRGEASRQAARILGSRPPRLLGLADQRLDAMPLLDLVQRIEAELNSIRPSLVYTHFPHDLNADHCLVAQAVLTACRPLPDSTVTGIYGFETPSSTEWAGAVPTVPFVPSRFVDIAATLEAKMNALRAYGSEMRPFPHARSTEAVEALARWRGASSGLAAAEAFVVLREVVRG
jgi:N-acetylglucosamine malate deacetylase 1